MGFSEKQRPQEGHALHNPSHGVRSYLGGVSDGLANHVLAVLLLLRLVNAFSLRTFFQPDEYFQALEPAWNIAFGPSSGAWLTWEWEHQLRSSLHPALFAGVYVVAENVMRLLRLMPSQRAAVLVALPKVPQACLAALSDFYTWKLAEDMYGIGSNASWAALWMTALNPWQWYCSTRTFSNSLETTLTIMALYHWPWSFVGDTKEKAEDVSLGGTDAQSLRLSLILAAIAVILRPTNFLIWAAVLTMALTRMTLDGTSPLTRDTLVVLFSEILLCGTLVLAVSAASDCFYFGSWTFPPYKWLHFNLSQNLAVFYGSNDWHYYLSQGIPLLTTTLLPFALLGLYNSTAMSGTTKPIQQSNTRRTLSFAVLTTLGSLSVISHKEVRFIYPLLPILHVLAAPHTASFFTKLVPAQGASSAAPKTPSYKIVHKPILSILLLINLTLASYLSLFHQPAPLSVLTFLRSEYERLHPTHLSTLPPDLNAAALADSSAEGVDDATAADELFALFLTPCHSTPWRSHLVYPGLRARALTCEPPLDTAPGSVARRDYRDEADRFYAAGSPGETLGLGFLGGEMWPLRGGAGAGAGQARDGEVPRYIVGFEGVEGVLLEFFDGRDGVGKDMGVELRRVWEGWNGLFNEDWRRRGLLVVWDTGVHRDASR